MSLSSKTEVNQRSELERTLAGMLVVFHSSVIKNSFPACISFSENLWMRVQNVNPENCIFGEQHSSLQSSRDLSLEALRAVF